MFVFRMLSFFGAVGGVLGLIAVPIALEMMEAAIRMWVASSNTLIFDMQMMIFRGFSEWVAAWRLPI